jgi:hypothetical protein
MEVVPLILEPDAEGETERTSAGLEVELSLIPRADEEAIVMDDGVLQGC